jgi:hypothetical protein
MEMEDTTNKQNEFEREVKEKRVGFWTGGQEGRNLGVAEWALRLS